MNPRGQKSSAIHHTDSNALEKRPQSPMLRLQGSPWWWPLVQFESSSRFSRVRLFVTPWTVTHQAPLSTGFSRQEYWSGLPCPPPGDHPCPGIKPVSPASPALAGRFFTTSTTWRAQTRRDRTMIPSVWRKFHIKEALICDPCARSGKGCYHNPHDREKAKTAQGGSCLCAVAWLLATGRPGSESGLLTAGQAPCPLRLGGCA